MEKVNKHGQMAQFTMETGSVTKLKVQESLFILMVMCMKEIGSKIWRTDRELIVIQAAELIKVLGKMIFRMA